MDVRLARCACCEEHVDEKIVALTFGVDQLTSPPTLVSVYLVHPTESGLTFISKKLQGSYCLSELHKIHTRDNSQHCEKMKRNYAGVKWTQIITDDVTAYLTALLRRFPHATRSVQDTVAAILEYYRRQSELKELTSRFDAVHETPKKRRSGSHSSTKPITKENVETSLRRVINYVNQRPNAHVDILQTFRPGVSRIFDEFNPAGFNANFPESMAHGVSDYGVNFAHLLYKIINNTRFLSTAISLGEFMRSELKGIASVREKLEEANALFVNGRYLPVSKVTLTTLLRDASCLVDAIPLTKKLSRRF